MKTRPFTLAAVLLAAAVPAHGQRSAAPVVQGSSAPANTSATATANANANASSTAAPPARGYTVSTTALASGAGAAHGATAHAHATAPSPAPSTASPGASPTARLPALAALDCMIQPHQVVQVGSPAPGVIDSIQVDRGDVVQRGQPVVHLNATVERAALAVARERAGQTGDTTVATSSRELAQRELIRGEELHQQQYVSKTYLDKLRAEAGVANGRTDQANERRNLSTREADLAAAQLEQRTVRAPISGVVLERLMSPGEYVDQKPMLRIAAIDPLRVDVLVPAAAFGQVSPGMLGRVTPEILNRSIHSATVKTVDRVIDAASNTFRVRLELPNPGNAMPAGLRCKVDLSALAMPLQAAPAIPVRPTAAALATQTQTQTSARSMHAVPAAQVTHASTPPQATHASTPPQATHASRASAAAHPPVPLPPGAAARPNGAAAASVMAAPAPRKAPLPLAPLP